MTTSLAARIRRIIEADGPISLAAYMAHCLGDPEHGYYMTRDPLGAAGDFVTAPEVSQMFGEIVGAWLAHAWELAPAPRIRLVELGPGRGTLMADVLRVAARHPHFCAAVSVHLVETSPVLVVANEFFDALPIRQFIRSEGAWRERVVGLNAAGQLSFGIGPELLAEGPEAPEGAVLEVAPAGEALAGEIARRIAADGGAALIVDYGYATGGPGETLQAMRRHAFVDPLAAPGEADLTAHVDFATLARQAKAAGAAVHGPIAQGKFLLSLGLRERAERLGAAAAAPTRETLRASVERLAGAEGMGGLFKVLALTRPGVTPPPFAAGI